MAPPTLNTIVKDFQKKYMLALQVDAAQFILDVLQEHDVPEEDVEASLDHLAKGYLHQEFDSNLVTKEHIERVYELLQVSGPPNSDRHGAGTYALGEDDEIDPDQHLFFVDAFDMPRWTFALDRNTFDKATALPTMGGSPASRAAFLRDRYQIIKQIISRNEHFTPSVMPGQNQDQNKLTSTKNLLGRSGQTFMLLGMLSHTPDGKLCLEDIDGIVHLDVSESAPSQGLITEGCFVLVEGEYTDEETLKVFQIGHPPSERRGATRSIYGHVDFLGKGGTTPAEDEEYAKRIQDFPLIAFVVISDLWLDHPKTLPGLRSVLEKCLETEFNPFMFIFCGNFTTRGIGQGSTGSLRQYTENFNNLAELLAEFPAFANNSHFLFVPGPLDPWGASTLPQAALPEPLVARIKARLPRANFCSNPCRIKFFGQEIVIFREDLMARVLRNLVGVQPEADALQLKRYLVQMVVDQGHLSPLPLTVQPVLWEFDHALRLYPTPTALIMADKHERYEETYEGCHIFNPGSFIGNSFGFSTYFPWNGRSEESMMEADDGR